MAGKVCLRLGAQELQELVEHRRHQRPSAEMAVEAYVEQPHRLVLAQMLESVAVDLEEAARCPAQHAVVDEIAPGKSDDVAVRGGLPARQADVERVTVPGHALCTQEIEGVLG